MSNHMVTEALQFNVINVYMHVVSIRACMSVRVRRCATLWNCSSHVELIWYLVHTYY